jgi:hypothetical protein
MKNRIIAAVTAIALTLTSAAATPAMAQDKGNDALKVLLGAAAIGLLISQANKNKRDDKPKVTRNTQYGHWQPNRNYGHDKRRIPAQCVFSVRGHDVVSSRCLQEYGVARNVPSGCAFVINTSWGKRTVYGSRCLRDRGYRIASYR